jgi:hypothetical protein
MLIPRESTHIIFSPFLENNIRWQFGEHTKIEIFPHKTISQTSSSIRE